MGEPIIELEMKDSDLTRKGLREYYLRRRRGLLIASGTILAFFLILLASEAPYLRYMPFDFWVRAAVAIFCALLVFCMPFWEMYMNVGRSRKLYGTLPATRVCFGDTILISALNDRVEYRYEWIKKTRCYRYSYVIYMKSGRELRLGYEAFTKGDLDGLRALLREKCPNLKVIK